MEIFCFRREDGDKKRDFFVENEKSEKKSKNLLTNLDFCDKILNCIIIACSMETYAPNDGFAVSDGLPFVQIDDCA